MEAQGYNKLVEALRCCAENFGCPIECPRYSPADEGVRACVSRLEKDAAAAIEEIEAKNKELHGRIEDKELQIDMLTADNTNYDIAIDELKAQLPKRGEWVWKHRHHGGFKTAKGKCECGRDVYAQIDERYETDDPYCPFCGVMNDSIHLNYCPNCGAKMEVQDADS